MLAEFMLEVFPLQQMSRFYDSSYILLFSQKTSFHVSVANIIVPNLVLTLNFFLPSSRWQPFLARLWLLLVEILPGQVRCLRFQLSNTTTLYLNGKSLFVCLLSPGDAVVNVYINHEKKFAFVEMRSVEEASNAMALDGIIFEVILLACFFIS